MTFLGKAALDNIILSYFPDKDLCNIFQTNKYFKSFNHNAMLWKTKIINIFGSGHIKDYSGTDFKHYYVKLKSHARCYEIPKDISWKTHLNERDYKICYGDLVVVNNVQYIFNGRELLEFKYWEYDLTVMQTEFHVLSGKNNFPVDYWINYTNGIVWLRVDDFKFEPAKFQQIADVNQDGIEITIVYTNFEYNGKKYSLLYTRDECQEADECKTFDKILSRFKYLPMESGDDVDFEDGDCEFGVRDYATGILLTTNSWYIQLSDPDLWEGLEFD